MLKTTNQWSERTQVDYLPSNTTLAMDPSTTTMLMWGILVASQSGIPPVAPTPHPQKSVGSHFVHLNPYGDLSTHAIHLGPAGKALLVNKVGPHGHIGSLTHHGHGGSFSHVGSHLTPLGSGIIFKHKPRFHQERSVSEDEDVEVYPEYISIDPRLYPGPPSPDQQPPPPDQQLNYNPEYTEPLPGYPYEWPPHPFPPQEPQNSMISYRLQKRMAKTEPQPSTYGPYKPLFPFELQRPFIFQPLTPTPFTSYGPFRSYMPRLSYGPQTPILPKYPQQSWIPYEPYKPYIPYLLQKPLITYGPYKPLLPYLLQQPLLTYGTYKPLIPYLPPQPLNPYGPQEPRIPYLPQKSTIPYGYYNPLLLYLNQNPISQYLPQTSPAGIKYGPYKPLTPYLPHTPLIPYSTQESTIPYTFQKRMVEPQDPINNEEENTFVPFQESSQLKPLFGIEYLKSLLPDKDLKYRIPQATENYSDPFEPNSPLTPRALTDHVPMSGHHLTPRIPLLPIIPRLPILPLPLLPILPRRPLLPRLNPFPILPHPVKPLRHHIRLKRYLAGNHEHTLGRTQHLSRKEEEDKEEKKLKGKRKSRNSEVIRKTSDESVDDDIQDAGDDTVVDEQGEETHVSRLNEILSTKSQNKVSPIFGAIKQRKPFGKNVLFMNCKEAANAEEGNAIMDMQSEENPDGKEVAENLPNTLEEKNPLEAKNAYERNAMLELENRENPEIREIADNERSTVGGISKMEGKNADEINTILGVEYRENPKPKGIGEKEQTTPGQISVKDTNMTSDGNAVLENKENPEVNEIVEKVQKITKEISANNASVTLESTDIKEGINGNKSFGSFGILPTTEAPHFQWNPHQPSGNLPPPPHPTQQLFFPAPLHPETNLVELPNIPAPHSGNTPPSYNNPHSGNAPPSYNNPHSGNAPPSYTNLHSDNTPPSYNNPNYGNTPPSYNNPHSGNTPPSYNNPNYGNTPPSYNNQNFGQYPYGNVPNAGVHPNQGTYAYRFSPANQNVNPFPIPAGRSAYAPPVQVPQEYTGVYPHLSHPLPYLFTKPPFIPYTGNSLPTHSYPNYPNPNPVAAQPGFKPLYSYVPHYRANFLEKAPILESKFENIQPKHDVYGGVIVPNFQQYDIGSVYPSLESEPYYGQNHGNNFQNYIPHYLHSNGIPNYETPIPNYAQPIIGPQHLPNQYQEKPYIKPNPPHTSYPTDSNEEIDKPIKYVKPAKPEKLSENILSELQKTYQESLTRIHKLTTEHLNSLKDLLSKVPTNSLTPPLVHGANNIGSYGVPDASHSEQHGHPEGLGNGYVRPPWMGTSTYPGYGSPDPGYGGGVTDLRGLHSLDRQGKL